MVSLLFTAYQFFYVHRPKAPELVVSDLAASTVETDGVFVLNEEVVKFRDEAAQIQISLRNNGTAPANITRAIFTVRAHEHLESCAQIGDEEEIEYLIDVEAPLQLDASQLPWRHEVRNLRFIVPTEMDKSVEFVGFTFSTSYANPWVFPVVIAVDIALVHDAHPDPLDVGTARLVIPATFTGPLENLTTGAHLEGDPLCNRSNAKKIEAVAATAPSGLEANSPQFDKMLAAYRNSVRGVPYAEVQPEPVATS